MRKGEGDKEISSKKKREKLREKEGKVERKLAIGKKVRMETGKRELGKAAGKVRLIRMKKIARSPVKISKAGKNSKGKNKKGKREKNRTGERGGFRKHR